MFHYSLYIKQFIPAHYLFFALMSVHFFTKFQYSLHSIPIIPVQ
jgi:hypothetical protein